jgi:conserved oligomeric Golgi complex subunit 2
MYLLLMRCILFNIKARKTESSLQRLRQGAQRRVGASTDASDNIISDTDKICMQLFLDVQVC